MNKNILLTISLLLSINVFINSADLASTGDGGAPEGKSIESSDGVAAAEDQPAFQPKLLEETAAEKCSQLLFQAIAENDFEKIDKLLSSLIVNVFINIQNQHGGTALMFASDKGHTDIARLLIEGGANKDIQDRTGTTALMFASLQGHVATVRLLLEAGANKDMQTQRGTTALMSASYRGHADISRILLDSGANVDLQNSWRHTALEIANRRGHHEIS